MRRQDGRVKSLDLDPDLIALDLRRPDLHGLGAGRIGRLAGADEEPPLVKRAFDLLADDRALAERARPVRAFVDADEEFVAELVDGVGLVIDHRAGRELAAHLVGAADHQLAHGSAKLRPQSGRFNGRDDWPRAPLLPVALQPAMVAPPSTMMVWPVMKLPSRAASSTAAPAISSGSPRRPSGVSTMRALARASSSQRARAKSVLMRPGAMQLTRILCGPHSAARPRASCASAAFAAP